MKKNLALGLVAASAALSAQAQSNVTIYGNLDSGIGYVSNLKGYSSFRATNASLQSTNWGLKGSEDLGDGTRAIFELRSSFSVLTGASWPSGSIFGSRATVGLADARYGTLTFGRTVDSMVEYLWPYSGGGDWGGSHFAHPYDNDNIWGTYLVNNAVRYVSPKFNGLSFGGMFAFSNKASSSSGGSGFADNSMWGTGAKYVNGNLSMALVYEKLSNPGDDTSSSKGAIDTDDYNFTATSQNLFGFGVLYNFPSVTVAGNITRTNISQPTSLWSNSYFTGANAMAFTNYEVNAVYHLTSRTDLKAAYTYTRASVSGKSPHWNQIGAIAEYAFTKRTSVYAAAIYQKVDGDGSQFGRAQINNFSLSSTDSQSALLVGMKHSF